MQLGDIVVYKDNTAEIIMVKWGLYCIRFLDTRKQIWVAPDLIKRQDF